MNIYNDYIDTIKFAIASDKKSGHLSKGLSGFDGSIRNFAHKDYRTQLSEAKLLPSLAEFAGEVGLVADFDQKLGLHPDFAHLKNTTVTENHSIISMFVDIKGSTNLFKKYSAETVHAITNTIQKAAIHTCLIFGGYVHRLQGDGLFVYYGGKGKDISNSTLRALQSSGVFTYFVKNDLKNLFDQQGIENITTRIGIDLGFDEDVVWACAGIGEISEVTTCSLHTSLASKMQGSAASNGVVVGDNIKKQVNNLQSFFASVVARTKEEKDRYIFKIPDEGFNYAQYDFDWLTFLKKQDFIATDLIGNLTLKRKAVKMEHKIPQTLRPIAAASQPFYSE